MAIPTQGPAPEAPMTSLKRLHDDTPDLDASEPKRIKTNESNVATPEEDFHLDFDLQEIVQGIPDGIASPATPEEATPPEYPPRMAALLPDPLGALQALSIPALANYVGG